MEIRKQIYDSVYQLLEEGKLSQTSAKRLLKELLEEYYALRKLDNPNH